MPPQLPREKTHQKQNITKKKVQRARPTSHLHGGAVGDSLIGVDGLAELLAVEEVLQHLLDLGDARRAAHQHNVMDAALVYLRVLHTRSHSLSLS